MIKQILRVVLVIFFQNLSAQVTFIVNDFPEITSKDQSIYISGDFENWSGGDNIFKLTKNDESYSITLPKIQEVINYKFTQGSWDSVETDSINNNIKNRTHTFNYILDTINIKIENWANLNKKKSTASKNVKVINNDFEIPQLERKRRISVYLPPNYSVSTEKYPVLYMHDGQNLFDEATATTNEWKIDEILDKLYKEKKFKLIVVGIDSDKESRISEYSPWENEEQLKPEGDAYLDFIVNTLKPEIDEKYRTKSDFKNTAMMGSAMGGLITHYAGLKYPKTFGKLGVFSPSFWFSESSFDFAAAKSKNNKSKMYFLAGYNEELTIFSDVISMVKLMKSSKFKNENIKNKLVQGGKHGELFWGSEFEEAVLWLFAN